MPLQFIFFDGGEIFKLRAYRRNNSKTQLVCTWLNAWPVANFAQQLLTTRNNMQQGVQTDATCNIQQCYVRALAANKRGNIQTHNRCNLSFKTE